MKITIREFIKELLENENECLIMNYVEFDNGGFDLSVRINERFGEKVCCMPEEKEK